jgi:hypothetical protein
LLERGDAEKAKEIKVLEKKYQDVLDLNRKEYDAAQQEVREDMDAHHECLDHYLDLFHLCNGKTIDTEEPINHTKLLRKWGYKSRAINLNIFSEHFSARACIYGRRSALETPEGLPDVRASGDPIGWAPRADSRPLSSSVAVCIFRWGP